MWNKAERESFLIFAAKKNPCNPATDHQKVFFDRFMAMSEAEQRRIAVRLCEEFAKYSRIYNHPDRIWFPLYIMYHDLPYHAMTDLFKEQPPIAEKQMERIYIPNDHAIIQFPGIIGI